MIFWYTTQLTLSTYQVLLKGPVELKVKFMHYIPKKTSYLKLNFSF